MNAKPLVRRRSRIYTRVAIVIAGLTISFTAEAQPIGTQGFADIGTPTAGGSATGNLNTATSFAFGGLTSTTASTGIFTAMPTQFFGTVSFDITSDTSLTFGNSVFGTFTSTSFAETINNPGQIAIFVAGEWTPGTYGGVTGGPFLSDVTISFTQTPASSGSISGSATFATPEEIPGEIPEPATSWLFGISLAALACIAYWRRKRDHGPDPTTPLARRGGIHFSSTRHERTDKDIDRRSLLSTAKAAGLVICMLGLLAGIQLRADAISFTIVANGTTIQIGPGSPLLNAGSTSNSASVNITALNSALAGAGSAYQFSSLGASSNSAGTASSADLTLSGFVQMVGPGSTSLTIMESESGLTSPVGAAANLQNSSRSNFSNARLGGTETSVGPLNSTLTPSLALTVPSLSAPYATLNNPIYFDLTSPADVVSNPEPSSWSLLGISLAALAVVAHRRRKRTVSS